MKILIVGGGSIGSTYGAFLSRDGANDVSLLVRRQDHADAVNADGISIHYRDGKIETFPMRAILDVTGEESYDLILFSTKVYDLENAFESVRAVVNSNTVVMSIQNGVQHYDLLQKAFPDNLCIGAVSYSGLNRKSDNAITFAGMFKTFIGVNEGNADETLRDIQAMFKALDLHCDIQLPIKEAFWKKQMLTSMQQAVASLTGYNFGQLVNSEHARAITHDLFMETRNVAKSQGVDISLGMLDEVFQGWEASAQHKPSMVADFQNGRKTEIHMANGYIDELARQNGLDTPVNRTLYHIVKAIEESRQ